jgi:hypothetical protein
MSIGREEFDSVVNRLSALEIRVDGIEEYQKQIANALMKLKKRDYGYENKGERNWMIYAAETLLKWSRKKIAGIFNLTEVQVGNIINEISFQYTR